MSNRNLFSELSTALTEAKRHSKVKLILKNHQVNDVSELNIPPDEIINIREQFNITRGVFAHLLHTSSRNLENWEQGKSTSKGQAITLLKLVQRHPETLSYITKL